MVSCSLYCPLLHHHYFSRSYPNNIMGPGSTSCCRFAGMSFFLFFAGILISSSGLQCSYGIYWNVDLLLHFLCSNYLPVPVCPFHISMILFIFGCSESPNSWLILSCPERSSLSTELSIHLSMEIPVNCLWRLLSSELCVELGSCHVLT